MLHVRHAAAAIEAGLCKTVLITHGESGKSRSARLPRSAPPDSLHGQFEVPFGVDGPADACSPIPVLRYMKTYGITEEQLAMVAGGAARVGGEEPARHVQGPDHRRGRARTRA